MSSRHSCRFCEGPPQQRARIRNSADAKAYFECFDARFPPLYTRLAGVVAQLERATR